MRPYPLIGKDRFLTSSDTKQCDKSFLNKVLFLCMLEEKKLLSITITLTCVHFALWMHVRLHSKCIILAKYVF
jgi:hypothetical protein